MMMFDPPEKESYNEDSCVGLSNFHSVYFLSDSFVSSSSSQPVSIFSTSQGKFTIFLHINKKKNVKKEAVTEDEVEIFYCPHIA